MKLVVLYGPPGVGKLTVARALAKKTDFKVLHNHLTIELLCSLFDWGSKPYNELVKKYRFELLEMAAKSGIHGVITTVVYAAEADEKEMRELLRRMRRRHVQVFFVQLDASQPELEKRVRHESRKAYTKIRHISSLRSFMKKYNARATIPFGNNIVIDTTLLSVLQITRKILHHLEM